MIGVKKYPLGRSGVWSIKSLLAISIATLLSTAVGCYLVARIVNWMHIDLIIPTIILVWCAATFGVFVGQAIGGHCRNLLAFSIALVPTAILCLTFAVLFNFTFIADEITMPWLSIPINTVLNLFDIIHYEPDSFESGLLCLVESVLVAGTPVFLYLNFDDARFCERCKVAFENTELYEALSHKPEAIVAALGRGETDLQSVVQSPAAGNRGRLIAVTAAYCPGCYDAVVDVNMTLGEGDDARDVLVYSDFWSGENAQALLAPHMTAPPEHKEEPVDDKNEEDRILRSAKIQSSLKVSQIDSLPEAPSENDVITTNGFVTEFKYVDLPTLPVRIVAVIVDNIPYLGSLLTKGLIQIAGREKLITYEFTTDTGGKEVKVVGKAIVTDYRFQDPGELLGRKLLIAYQKNNPAMSDVVEFLEKPQ